MGLVSNIFHILSCLLAVGIEIQPDLHRFSMQIRK